MMKKNIAAPVLSEAVSQRTQFEQRGSLLVLRRHLCYGIESRDRVFGSKQSVFRPIPDVTTIFPALIHAVSPAP